MQKTQTIDKDKLFELFKFILSDSKALVYESYSKMEEELILINDFSEFKNYFESSILKNEKNFMFGIYYPEGKGNVSISKINLDPKRCNGKTYRYTINGWGIIGVNLNWKSETQIECYVSVNSKKRAENWESINPEFGSPELWDWKIIESNTRKIINRLK